MNNDQNKIMGIGLIRNYINKIQNVYLHQILTTIGIVQCDFEKSEKK